MLNEKQIKIKKWWNYTDVIVVSGNDIHVALFEINLLKENA